MSDEGLCSRTIRKADPFSQDLQILFEDGHHRLKTHCGVVLGIIMMTLLALYAWYKGTIMLDYMDNSIQEPTRKDYFDANFTYDGRDGMNFAFGLTSYDGDEDEELDPSYGRLVAYQWGWEDQESQKDEIPSRPCNPDEIDLDGTREDDATRFFQPSVEFEPDIRRFYHKANCMTEPFVL